MDQFTWLMAIVGGAGFLGRLWWKNRSFVSSAFPAVIDFTKSEPKPVITLAQRLADLDEDAADFEYQAAVLASATKEQRPQLRAALRKNNERTGG